MIDTPKNRKELVGYLSTTSGYSDKHPSEAEEILNHLEAAGLAVVPVEPTEKMADAWACLALQRLKQYLWSDEDRRPGVVEGAKESYRAMLAASPLKEKTDD